MDVRQCCCRIVLLQDGDEYFGIFIFKQMRAYEMLSSLVGSEMCRKDRGGVLVMCWWCVGDVLVVCWWCVGGVLVVCWWCAVYYTHLTLSSTTIVYISFLVSYSRYVAHITLSLLFCCVGFN